MKDQILSELQAHQPADARERLHLDSCLLLANFEKNCLDSGHFDPGHFTASSFVLSPNHDAVLMIFHAKLQRWLQPGGHVESSDASVESAARREIEEETGVTGLKRLTPAGELFDVDVHEIPARKSIPAHYHHDLRLLFVASSTDVVVGDGVEAARFVPLDELEATLEEASLLRPIKKIRSRLQELKAEA